MTSSGADGTVTPLSGDNHRFYIPADARQEPGYPFESEDPFEVIIVDDIGIVLTPPDQRITLQDLLDALGPRVTRQSY